MDSATTADKRKKLLLQFLVGGALVASMALTLRTFFVMYDILLVGSAWIVARTVELETQQKDILVTIGDVWIFGGGAIWLIAMVIGSDYFFKRLTERKTHMFIFWSFVIQLCIFFIWWLMG